MIIDQPFNYDKTLMKLTLELENYLNAHLRAIVLYYSLKDIFQIESSEFRVGDFIVTYNSLHANIHLTETGIFNSIEELVEKISKSLEREPEISDNQYSKGKNLNWPAIYGTSARAGLYITVYGNSKCKLVVTKTETRTTNEYRVECGELQEIKAITHVQNDNAVGSDNGRLGRGKNLFD